MLLAIDVGNTKIAIGVFENDMMRAHWRIATNPDQMPDEYAALLFNLLSHSNLMPSDMKKAIICSVVPPMTTTFEQLCHRYFGISPLIVGAGVKTGMSIRMDNPREVGADRIANAVAARHLYGKPVIVIDLGTATTFDVVSKEGDYLGGAIAPGIGISMEALCQHTAQLPRVELVQPEHVIGKNTIAAMQSGLIFGYIGLIENIISHIRHELGEKARVVATGSLAEVITTEVPMEGEINPNLTLEGLNLIYKMNTS